MQRNIYSIKDECAPKHAVLQRIENHNTEKTLSKNNSSLSCSASNATSQNPLAIGKGLELLEGLSKTSRREVRATVCAPGHPTVN
jgi:hypothetical protein